MLNKTLFIELDSLFDTRLAVLYNSFGEDIVKLLPKYKTRLIDSFPPLVNSVEFLKVYNQRNKNDLRNSMKTEIFTLAKDFVNEAVEEMRTSPYPAAPKIILNTHPYDLTNDEKQIFLKLMLKTITEYADYEIVDLPNNEITPKYLNDNVDMLIKYDYAEWFESQALHNTYVTYKCPDVKFITPAILNMDEKGLREVAEKEKESPMGTFESFKFVFADLIELEFAKPSLFSYSD